MRWVAPLLLLACSSSDPKGPPPSGCGYPHCDDFKVDPTKVVRNPAVKLRREYWVVFEAEKGVAMFPRPDNSAMAFSICGSGTPEATLFARNGICPPVDIAKANAMTLEDAFAVSTALHARFRFDRLSTIQPFPFTDDLIGVCDENPAERAGVLKAVCDRSYRRRATPSGGTDEFVGFTAEESAVLPALLNKLYGVPS